MVYVSTVLGTCADVVKICVIIPTYNEARTIGNIVEEIRKIGLDVLVIDDGSEDDTATIAKQKGAVVLRAEKNRGKGMSLRKGFSYALKNGYSAVITMDGDGQHSPLDIKRFIKAGDSPEVGLVLGNRTHNLESMPFIRRLTNRVMSFLISTLLYQKIPDSQCGYRLIKSEVLDRIYLSTERFEIESEVVLKAAIQGYKIISVPIRTIYKDGISRIRPLMDTCRFVVFIFKYLLYIFIP